MKKIKLVFMLVLVSAMFMTGCAKTCKIDGCKSEIYKDGLCQKHYYVNQGADAVESAVKGIVDILK